MKNKIGYFIIASAIVWGGVIWGCAFTLKGMAEKQAVVQILSLGIVVHLLFIWGPMVVALKKNKKQ